MYTILRGKGAEALLWDKSGGVDICGTKLSCERTLGLVVCFSRLEVEGRREGE